MIQAMLIDDAVEFYELFKDKIKKENIDVNLTWISDPSEMDCDNKYDIYFVDNRFAGIDKGADTIDLIKKIDGDACVFVFSGQGNYVFLKSLFRQKVDGYADKHDDDFSAALNMLRIISKTKATHLILEEKLKKLEMLKVPDVLWATAGYP